MIKEALQYIVGMGEAREHHINGESYSDKPLYHVQKYIPLAKREIEMNTLTSLVDYIRECVEYYPETMIIDVHSPTEVRLYSALNENREREEIARVGAMVPEFPFNTFIDSEKFIIGMQSKFVDGKPGELADTDKALVLQFAGTVEAGTVSTYGDDGVSQKATVKTSITSKEDMLVPNPVCLRPYRTFLEVEQPKSDFVFRMKQTDFGVTCAIFEADGGAWKMEAMQSIKEYLRKELKDIESNTEFIVIS